MSPCPLREDRPRSSSHPDDLVELELEPDRQVVIEDVADDGPVIGTVDRGEEDFACDRVVLQYVLCVPAVLLVPDHELHAVSRPDGGKERKIACLPRGGAFDVHGDGGEQVEKGVFLEQRLPARDAYQVRVLSPALFEDLFAARFRPALLRVRGVTPAAGEVAACKPDEQAGPALIFPLALEALKNLGDLHLHNLGAGCRGFPHPDLRYLCPEPQFTAGRRKVVPDQGSDELAGRISGGRDDRVELCDAGDHRVLLPSILRSSTGARGGSRTSRDNGGVDGWCLSAPLYRSRLSLQNIWAREDIMLLWLRINSVRQAGGCHNL